MTERSHWCTPKPLAFLLSSSQAQATIRVTVAGGRQPQIVAPAKAGIMLPPGGFLGTCRPPTAANYPSTHEFQPVLDACQALAHGVFPPRAQRAVGSGTGPLNTAQWKCYFPQWLTG